MSSYVNSNSSQPAMAPPRSKTGADLLFAAKSGDAERVERILRSACDVNEEDQFGNNALKLAELFHREEVVSLLLRCERLDVNRRSKKSGDTALIWAVREGRQAFVEKLFKTRSDLDFDIQDKNGMTALMLAIFRREKDIVEAFLASSSLSENARSQNQTEALRTAMHLNQEDLVTFIESLQTNAKHSDATSTSQAEGTQTEQKQCEQQQQGSEGCEVQKQVLEMCRSFSLTDEDDLHLRSQSHTQQCMHDHHCEEATPSDQQQAMEASFIGDLISPEERSESLHSQREQFFVVSLPDAPSLSTEQSFSLPPTPVFGEATD